VGPRRLPLGGCAAQGLQEGSLLDGIMVRVLGLQPCRPGAVLTDQRLPRPAPGAENLREPPRVFLIDALSLRCQLVREPDHIPARLRRHQMADPLIFITPGQQLPPQLVIHAAIPPRRALERNTVRVILHRVRLIARTAGTVQV
jgi:hypothetical protein